MIKRFFCPPENIKEGKIKIDGEDAHHILNVMRLGVGDKVVIFDGAGKEYIGPIEEVSKNKVIIKIEDCKETAKADKQLKITLAQAIPKKAKIDDIIRQSVELGVDAIIPLVTDRTVVKLDKQREQSRRARWSKIAKEASKQSGRARLPLVEEVKDFKDVLASIEDYDLAILLSLSNEAKNLKGIIRDTEARRVIVFIGPEGGFTHNEERLAQEAGCILGSLGQMTLRTDTAAISILSILSYELG